MEVQHYYVGQVVPEWATKEDGCILDYNDMSGFTLLYFMNRPNAEERAQFLADNRFQAAFTVIADVGFFCLKVGRLPWSDSIFSPNLYATTPQFDPPPPGQGYALNLLLIDSATGQIQVMRLIGLGHEFTGGLRRWSLESLKKEMGREQYNRVADAVFGRYTTNELVERAWFRWST